MLMLLFLRRAAASAPQASRASAPCIARGRNSKTGCWVGWRGIPFGAWAKSPLAADTLLLTTWAVPIAISSLECLQPAPPLSLGRLGVPRDW
jgi:hypothetical protein